MIKKFGFLSFVLSCCAGFLMAQASLEFNRVLLVDSSTQTVPAGKVWKVESGILGLDAGIRKSPTFRINGNLLVLGYDSYNSSRWENVTSVELQARKTNSGSCTYNNVFTLRVLGSSPAGAIDQTFTSNINKNALTTSFSTITTFTPPSPGNNVMDKWQLYTHVLWYGWEYRLIVRKSNGDDIVYVYGYFSTSTSCNSSSTDYYDHLNTTWYSTNPPSNLYDLPRIDIARPQIKTEFPFWLPSGSTLKAGDNMRYLSVIEFNMIP